jgi:hypothetical protein
MRSACQRAPRALGRVPERTSPPNGYTPNEGADHAAGDIAVTDPEAPADVDSLVVTLAGFPAASCAATSATVEPIRVGDAPIDLIKSGHDASVKHRVPAREPLASLC